ncbi:MAG: hypothetical protein HYR85_22185 [Planctomycetes bacterium]|nr:hypothetical protein [Planctomycetota bacterium]MBI3843520.1 hypothetical protein [Planctomycetota bacterium]
MKSVGSIGAAAVLSSWVALAFVPLSARASVPADPPSFTNPLAITNLYQPFEPGGFKRYVGTTEGRRLDVTEVYLSETRTFRWNGGDVPTRILMEISVEAGHLSEITRDFFAQAVDGTVYNFGEIVDAYEDDVIVGHEGSWLVGGVTLPSDPPGTAAASNPTVFMPANPELGDEFKQEDLYPDVDETDTVRAVRRTIVVPAGSFEDVLGLVETSRLESGRQTVALAPGVGVVLTVKGEDRLALVSSTLRARERRR